MSQNLKDVVINRIRAPLEEYNTSFGDLLKTSQQIENRFVHDAELLSEIRKKFDILSAAVELEFEGISVFDQEIKKTKEILEQSIVKVNESLTVSNRISKDLDDISKSFDIIHGYAEELDDIVKNIASVSDSIEVASRNAGITAFHAGEQGRGFEVISREMTMLVRSVQKPTRLIPEVSEEIVKGTDDLGQDLLRIGNIVHDLVDINDRFSSITSELLALIPNIEDGIKNLAKSVKSQKELHQLLLTENERSSQWLNNIQDIARSSAILEQYLEAMFRRVSNIRESLMAVEDNTSFAWIFNNLKVALTDASKSYAKGMRDLSDKDISQSDIRLSERSILQLVSESNQLSSVIGNIATEIKNWLKTNGIACDVLTKGVTFYQDIINILASLNKKLQTIRTKAERIDEPLFNLKKITERSRVLGLYASIESARGGLHSESLGVVTKEIKDLSEKTTSFVNDIDNVAVNITKSFDELSIFLIRSMSDVEQGVGSLKAATAILEKNKGLLQSLDNLALEMISSTDKMKTQCNDLSAHVRELNTDYENIEKGFHGYSETIGNCGTIAEELLKSVGSFSKEFAVITRQPKTIIYHQSVEPIILDPANKTDARSHEVIEQIFIGLLTFDSTNHMVPGMVDTFSVSEDGLIWDFKIKKNIKFHNGDMVSAKDVANTISRVKAGPNENFIDYVDDVKVLDELNLRFNLKFPYLPFLANLACGVCDITHRNLSVDKPNGAGPYKFIHWDKGKELVLEVFDDFFDGRPAIDRIVFRFIKDSDEAVERFKKGEISIMAVTPDTVKHFSPEEIVSGPGLSTQYIGINVKKETPFNNKKVRQAMNYAIDKDYFVDFAMEGQAIPARGVFPPGMYSYNKDLTGYAYDPDKARQLMAEAGFGSGLDSTYPFDIRDSEAAIKRAEYIIKSLEKIGIRLILNPLPWGDFLERGYRGESIICMKSWVSDNGDPDNFVYPLFHSKSFGRAGNTFYYSNHIVDTMIEDARSERSSQKRRTIYQEAEKMIVEDAPWVFLSHAVDTYAVSKKIGGFKVDPFGINKFRYLWSK
jgi:ABC-type transport system substrate-binding protein/methyl-accepting chemotaxis protein